MTTVTESTNNVLSSLARTESAKKAEEDPQARFLTLLTTQLQNQDPMNPMENAELTSQLAQMSTVEGIEKLNTMFQEFVTAQESADAVDAAALVGRGVLVPGSGMILTEAGGVGGFVLDEAADSVTVSIKDSTGVEVAKIELGEVEAGSHNYVWDGAAIDGTAAAAGQYTVSVSAMAGGEKVATTPLQYGVVSGVVRGSQGTDLQVGSLGIYTFDDVKQIL